MKPWERRAFNALALVVGLTGIAYGWMKYFVENPDPFAVVNHPWEPATLHVHVLASPLFILVFGIILNSHIMRKLRATRVENRKSGLASLITFGAMVASGYLLQVVTAEGWLEALVTVHVASGVVFSAAYGAHLLISVRLARAWAAAIREVA